MLRASPAERFAANLGDTQNDVRFCYLFHLQKAGHPIVNAHSQITSNPIKIHCRLNRRYSSMLHQTALKVVESGSNHQHRDCSLQPWRLRQLVRSVTGAPGGIPDASEVGLDLQTLFASGGARRKSMR